MFLPISVIVILILILVFMFVYIINLRKHNRVLKEKFNDALHKKAEIGNFLGLFAENLRNLEEIDNSMNMTARYVADLTESQSVCIFKMEEDYLRAEGVSGAFPTLYKSNDYVLTKPRYIMDALKRKKIKIGEGIIGEIARDREAILLEEAGEDPRIKGCESVVPIETLMAVPLHHEGNLIGVICVVNNRSEKPFSPEQFSRLKFIAPQVVLAHNIVQVYANLSKQQRINQELDFARQLQSSLLPKHFPDWDQFVVHSFTRSAKEVSGDFYDFVEIDQDRMLLVTGDACGKGIPACMLMGMTRSFIRSNIERFVTLKDLLWDLNDNLFRDTEEEQFVTLGCCLLDKKHSTIEYARAGHTPVIITVNDHIRKIDPEGTALGLLPTELANYDTICFEFRQDMTILMFTDGITEALNDKENEYGVDRLCEVFSKSCFESNSPDIVTKNILDSVDEFTRGVLPQTDDQTMVIIKHL